MAEAAGRTEQEERCEILFAELGKLFKRIGNTNKPEKIHAMLKDITAKLKEAKTLIKDFEREARADGVPPTELAERRKALANELNMYIAMKKNFGTGSENRSELLQGAGIREDTPIEGMTTQQLITVGRKEINEIDQTLSRAERLVEDTKNVGKETALTLHGQSTQLNKVVDDLNEIEMDMKKATRIIRDITRGLLTDKCIAFLLFLVCAGVVAIIVIKIIKPNWSKTKSVVGSVVNATTELANSTGITSGVNGAINNINTAVTNAASGRHRLRRQLYFFDRRLLSELAMTLLQETTSD